MKCRFEILLVLLVVVFSVPTNSLRAAQETQSAGAVSAKDLQEERLKAENLEKFLAWRATIPDYEKRLYDRVKGVNHRIIRVQNLVIGGVLSILVMIWACFRILSKRINAFLLTGVGEGAPTGGSDREGDRKAAAIGSAIQAVTKRQERINRKLSHLNTYLEDYEEERSRLSRALNVLEEEVRDIHSAVDGLQGRKE